MATQYTAGITQGQAWTAAIANQIGAAWETWTPTVTQGTTTFGITARDTCRYGRINKIVVAVGAVVISSGTGQLNQQVAISLPITPLRSTYNVAGSAWIYDASTATAYNATSYGIGGTATLGFLGDWSGGNSWGVTPAIQMTTSDEIRAIFIYEAA